MFRIWNFFVKDIWEIRTSELGLFKAWCVHSLRVPVLALRGYNEDRCALRASALTFYSLLSLVPILAMAFGIAQGFGFERTLEKLVYEWLAGQKEVADWLLRFTRAMLEDTKGGIMAGAGLGVLLWSVIRVFGHVESAFNNIWGITSQRTVGRKIIDYLAASILSPLLWTVSNASAVVVARQVRQVTEAVSAVNAISPAVLGFLSILPYLVIWVLLSFIYIFMPNGKIRWKSGIIAGIAAGTLFLMFQWVYISFQINVTRYNAVYGSFAALPLFLLWLSISWNIVLFGAEIAFAHQNADRFELLPQTENMSPGLQKAVMVWIARKVIQRFQDEQPPPTEKEMATELGLSLTFIQQKLKELTAAHIVTSTKPCGPLTGYVPGSPVEKLTITQVIGAIESIGSSHIPPHSPPELSAILEKMHSIAKTAGQSSQNLLIKDI